MSIGYSFAVVRKRPIPSGTAGLPERLREAREAMYLSQSKLSLLAGLGRITVHNIEERRTLGNVGIVTVEKLAKVLRVSPCWLAFGAQTEEAKVTLATKRGGCARVFDAEKA